MELHLKKLIQLMKDEDIDYSLYMEPEKKDSYFGVDLTGSFINTRIL